MPYFGDDDDPRTPPIENNLCRDDKILYRLLEEKARMLLDLTNLRKEMEKFEKRETKLLEKIKNKENEIKIVLESREVKEP